MRRLTISLFLFAASLAAQCKPQFDPILNRTVCAPSSSGITSIQQDTSPKLGGDLDPNGHKIVGDLPMTGSILSGTPSAAAMAALPTNAHGVVWDATSTVGVPGIGVCYFRADSVLWKIMVSCNGAAETPVGAASTNGTVGQVLTSDGAGGFGTPKDIGTTAGNLVDGADSRIVGAEQTINKTGNGPKYCSVLGNLTSGDIVIADVNGNCVDSGVLLSDLTSSLPPVISTASLPQGTDAAAYSATLTATGGAPPYTWSITSGALPTGMSLNTSTGAITGTPSTGSSTPTFHVTDSSTNSRSKILTINIAVRTPTVSDNLGGTYNNDTTVTFTDATAGTTINTCTAANADCTPSSGTTNPLTITASGTHACATSSKTGYVAATHCEAYTLKVATPTASPTPGTVTGGTTATWSSTTTSATFHYTTDSSTPTCSTGTTGSTATVSATTTYKVIGCKTNYTDSDVATFTYTVGAGGPAVHDTFTGGTAGDLLSTHTADTGQTWTAVSGTQTLDGIGNVQWASSTAGYGALAKSSWTPTSADYTVSIKYGAVSSASVFARTNGLSNVNGYQCFFNSGAGTLLQKWSAGSGVSLGTTDTTTNFKNWSIGDTLSIKVSGNTVTCYKNGVASTTATATDSSYTTGGVVMFSTKSGTKIDEFTVTVP